MKQTTRMRMWMPRWPIVVATWCCFLLTLQHAENVEGRGIDVNLTASWPSSPLFPLLETSEFLAEENPVFFWRFVSKLQTQVDTIASKGADVDALTELAVAIAEEIAPGSKNILELMLATRTYSVKVEMFRQLALDSGLRPCGAEAETWAVFYKEKHCVATVACSVNDLATVLKNGFPHNEEQTCVAAGVNDLELEEIDHKYSGVGANQTVILYGLIGTLSFYDFHERLEPLARENRVQYLVRHYPRNATLETLLQGYGVALDIKNMEYKTIDDSKKSTEDDEEALFDDDYISDFGIDEDAEEDDVEGFIFNTLLQRHGALSDELKEFRNSQAKEEESDQEIKAWHLRDLGIAAARDILDAKNPLRRLQMLSQDFPRHAKKLAFSRKLLSTEFREEIDSRRTEASQQKLKNKLVLNGIVIDPMQRSFNIFDFMNILKQEWTVSKRLTALSVAPLELETMLAQVRESTGTKQAVRIHVRGPADGSAPFYLNNIETDPQTAGWPSNLAQLKRPSWNLVFVRKNMYEFVIVFDPVTTIGREVLAQIAFLRMRGAPLQWGLLISSNELLECRTQEQKDALIEGWKTFKMEDKATAWHFSKLLFLARSKDDELSKSTDEEATKQSTQVVSAFIDGVVDESNSAMAVENLVNAYVDATYIVGTKTENEEEAIRVLRTDLFDDQVLEMTGFIEKKHLPLESTLFNGVLTKNLDVQNNIMGHFGRDQPIYQEMARNGVLESDSDLVEQLLDSQEAYSSHFSIYENQDDDSNSAKLQHLYSNDGDGQLERLLNQHISYLHGTNSIHIPKKQTLLLSADLSDPRGAAHAYHVVKAVLEGSEKELRTGIVHRVTADGKQQESTGDLVAAILDVVSESDEENHLKFVLEALNCVIRGKSLKAMKSKLSGILVKMSKDEGTNDQKLAKISKFLDSKNNKKAEWLSKKQRDGLLQINTLLDVPTENVAARLFINGMAVDLPKNSISDEDLFALTTYDLKYRTQPVAKALIKKSAKLTPEEAGALSSEIVKICGVVDQYKQVDRIPTINIANSSATVRMEGDPALHVVTYVDPLSEAAQVMSSILGMLHSQLNATVDLVLVPLNDHGEFPLQRFYRYLFDKKPSHANARVEFRKLPIIPILTMKIETPEAWNVQIHLSEEDLDNLRVDPDSPADLKAVKSAAFRLESLLVYGQCRDTTTQRFTPPNGLQLVLERELGTKRLHRDTLVMKNLGYFQLQATPGVWSLHLAKGRGSELFEIVDIATNLPVEAVDVKVYDFGSHITQLLVRKLKGKEHINLLEPSETTGKRSTEVEAIGEDAGVFGSYWDSMLSLLGKQGSKSKKNDSAITTMESTNSGRTGETIHVFSLATGHLYERFLKIMMSSVLKRTKNPVTFWLLENFLSPDFKKSIPALRDQFGMDIRLVTYKWPNWLRQQTQKQRIIWGYKILFLDVLFPLGVQKIIYVDADQVVRADLKELWEMDLQGAPYGYTPFCDSRNVGFQFWRQGYWKDHLRGRPYHISALYVVDLALFRQMAAGDMLRAVYDQLSADPNSLANLDQDLPNYAQHQIRIFSLPQEWLWCESWCSDETKAKAKTIDLCNNPKHKEPKLDMAKRVISGELFPESWIELDQGIKDAELKYAQNVLAKESQ